MSIDVTPVVLLVDDEPFIRMTTGDMLEDCGYNVISAASGAMALAAIGGAGKIDLLVSDLGLPDIPGEELCRRLRETRPDMPTLFITGYDSRELASRFTTDSRTFFLNKPFAYRDLAAILARVAPVGQGDARPAAGENSGL